MNPATLDALRDIHLPPSPALWLALEWWQWWLAAGTLALVVVLWAAWRFKRMRALRTALRELSRLAATHALDRDAILLARGLSQLLRRYATARFPQAGIAGLTGSAWLRFLDAHGGNGAFCRGVGATLDTHPYRQHGELDTAALVALVRNWLKANPQ